MRATRAYIASAGTASVLLGAALAMLMLVSAFVAFGAWPGTSSGKEIDPVLLTDVATPQAQKVAVGPAAVKAARRAEARRRVEIAHSERRGRVLGTRERSRAPRGHTPTGATAPASAGETTASAPGAGSPAGTVRDTAGAVTQGLDQTTKNVGTEVKNLGDKVQNQVVTPTTQQVNQVVDQVVGGVQQQAADTVPQVQSTVGDATGTVTGAVGGVKGTVGSALGP